MIHACSIVSTNFVGYARVLAESFLRYHPESKLTVLLLDSPPKDIDLHHEKFDIIFPEDIGVLDLDVLRMRYTAYELSMALRPWLLLYLLREKGIEKLLFLDADLYFVGALSGIESLLDTNDMILCPSFLSPIPDDGLFPSDKDILTAGTLNGGFMALHKTQETISTLSWLRDRLILYAYYRPEEGMFGDQKWLDFLPSIHQNFLVLRDKTYNVSHWNLHERAVVQEGNHYMIEGKPMSFYHFSGFEYDNASSLSKHQNRFDLKNMPAMKNLAHEYRKQLSSHGHDQLRTIPYAFDRFDNGVQISPIVRRTFEYAGAAAANPHPFKVTERSFFGWLMEMPRYLEDQEARLNNLQISIHTLCPEAHFQFQDPRHKDMGRFAHWLLSTRKKELALDPVFTKNLRGIASDQQLTMRQVWKMVLQRRHTFGPYQWLSKTVKAIIGKEIFYALKPKPDPTFPFMLRWKPTQDVLEHGVTIVGSVQGEHGIGVGARNHYQALQAVHVPCSLYDTRTSPGRQKNSLKKKGEKYATTLAACGMDELELVLASERILNGQNGQRIAYASWEVDVVPERFTRILQEFDEVWTPSTFASDILQRSTTKPVVTIPHAIDVANKISMNRSDIGIPSDRYVFLAVFDLFSYIERKNPFGIIRAFTNAFKATNIAHLVLAIGHSSYFPTEMQSIRDAIGNRSDITIIDGFRDHPNILGLMDACDAYISLHRTESFGLTIAESMALGKPVIATDYGGSRDFLDTNTGFLVPYTLVHLDTNIGPYPKGARWADPDIESASRYMHIIATNPSCAEEKRKRAAALMAERYSLSSIGTMMKKRLHSLDPL